MVATAGDIDFFYSGGASNVDPDLSLGGIISTTEITSGVLLNLFDTVIGSEASAGDIEYRCFYVKNSNLTDTIANASIWIESQTTSPDTDIAIGLDPAGVGDGSATGVATTVVNESTAPAGVVFSSPANAAAALSIGNLTTGQAQAVWVRRTVNAAASVVALDETVVTVRGEAS